MWWFRNVPLSLEQQEQLMKAKNDPSMTRTRTMPFDVRRTSNFMLFSIACAGAAVITRIFSSMLSGPLGPLLWTLNLSGLILMAFSTAGIVRWYRWRKRTPRYDGLLPGEVRYCNTAEQAQQIFHATQYGVSGALEYVLQQGKKLVTMEARSVETPKALTDQDRMQAVARALLVEAEFGRRPEYAYVVYPNKVFEARIRDETVKRLLDAVSVMRAATRTGKMPDATPAWHVCPQCPIGECPKRIGTVNPASLFTP